MHSDAPSTNPDLIRRAFEHTARIARHYENFIVVSFLLLLIPASAMGATLPVAVAARRQENAQRFGWTLGTLYGWNTLGAVGEPAGDTLTFIRGRHSLRANNTLVWRTVEFDAEPGVEVHYRCVNRAPESLYFMLFIFGVAPLYDTLERGAPSER